MTEQPIGVKAIWDGTQFGPGWQDYMKKIALANQATASNTKQIAEAWMRFESAFKRVGQGIKDDTKLIAESLMRMERDSKVAMDRLSKNIAIGNRLLAEVVSNTAQGLSSSAKTMATATKQIEVSGRKWIATISGIFAVLRMAPQIAEQFGDAMREAAGGTAMEEAFSNLAEFSRVSTDALIQNMKDASRNTINEVELIRAANRALMIGGMEFAGDVPRLLEISRAAAIATGKDVNWVFQTLTQGIARSSAKLIDNAEIYLRLGKVVDDYAESVGKTADELDSSTRQMIIRNAVMEQGGELVRAVGSDVDVATDKWDQYTTSITNAKQATLEFLNKTMGPLAPALAVVFTELNNIAPVLQTIALLKLAGVGQLITQLGGVTGILGAAFSALAIPVTLVTGAFLLYEKAIRGVWPILPSVGEIATYAADNLDRLSTSIQYVARELLDSKEAADEWFRSVTGLAGATTTAELVLNQYVNELGTGEEAYDLYLEKAQELNEELQFGAKHLEVITRAQFNFRQALVDSRGDLQAQVDLLREYGFEASKIMLGGGAGVNAILDALSFIGQKSEEEQRAARQQESNKRRAEREREFAADLQKERDKMRDDILKNEAKIAEDSEDIVKKHNAKMVDLAADAARDRADAFRDYQRGIRDAELKRNRSIEDASRKHRQNLIDIEYDYRRRVLEIEEEYQRTVYEAALGRDALAIIRARRRKQEELTGAGRDRQDAIRDEGINFRESLYQAERAYQDRLAAIRLALSDELQEIERKLAEGTLKEKQAYAEREQNLKDSLRRELAILKEELAKQDAEMLRSVRYRNALYRSLSGALPKYYDPDTGTTEMQEGFSGVVTGPHTFKVEPGVTEYVYASGNMAGGRQRVMPSAATNQSQGLRAMVGGAVNVGLSGFSNSLMQRVTESLTTTVGQAVMDEMATQILGA